MCEGTYIFSTYLGQDLPARRVGAVYSPLGSRLAVAHAYSGGILTMTFLPTGMPDLSLVGKGVLIGVVCQSKARLRGG